MQTLDKLKKAEDAVEDLCSHCSFCTPECYIFQAKEALRKLRYDWETYLQQEEELK